MINPQLLEYVRAQRASGLSKDAITQALASGGWSAQDANEAFMAIEGVKTPPPPPPSAPGPIAPRVVVPPQQAPMGGQTGMTPPAAPANVRPIIAASEFSTAPVQIKKKSHWLGILITVLVLVLIAAAGIWLYLNPSVITQYIPPNPFQTQEPSTYIPTNTPPVEIAPADTNGVTASTTVGVSVSTSTSSTTPH